MEHSGRGGKRRVVAIWAVPGGVKCIGQRDRDEALTGRMEG